MMFLTKFLALTKILMSLNLKFFSFRCEALLNDKMLLKVLSICYLLDVILEIYHNQVLRFLSVPRT